MAWSCGKRTSWPLSKPAPEGWGRPTELLVDVNQKMVGADEIPQAFAGELEEGGVPAAKIQRLQHRNSSPMLTTSPFRPRSHLNLLLMPAFSTLPLLRRSQTWTVKEHPL